MKKLISIFSIAIIMYLGFAQVSMASELMAEELSKKLLDFVNAKGTEEIPVYESYEDENIIAMLVLCGKERNSGKMIDDTLILYQDWKRDWTWNAYESGERAMNGIYSMYQFSYALGQNHANVPIQCSTLRELSLRNTGGNEQEYGETIVFTLGGLDSAYMCGENEGSNGIIKWEFLPFMVSDSDGTVLEETIYIYYRRVIPLADGEGEQIEECYFASQATVAQLLARTMELNADIEPRDRELMHSFIMYVDAI